MTPYEVEGNCYGDSTWSNQTRSVDNEAIMGGSTSAGPKMGLKELMSKCGMTSAQINHPVYKPLNTKNAMKNIMFNITRLFVVLLRLLVPPIHPKISVTIFLSRSKHKLPVKHDDIPMKKYCA